MKVEEIVNTYRNCGFIIKKMSGYYFLDRGWINYSFPQLTNYLIDTNLIKAIKWRFLLTIIKTKSPIKNTNEFVLDTTDYSIGKFAPKKRHDIRKSLKDCTFKRPSKEDLFNYGLKINQQTLARQGRKDKYLIDDKSWRKYITTFYEEENISILGAYISEKMVGYITVCKIDGDYYITDPFYDFNAAASSPTHGLIFTLVNELLNRDGSIKMYYGVESFSPLPMLNKYKQSMLFEKVPATRIYVINPLVLPFLKLVVYYYVSILKQRKIRSPWVQRIVSLVQGHRIIDKTCKKEKANI